MGDRRRPGAGESARCRRASAGAGGGRCRPRGGAEPDRRPPGPCERSRTAGTCSAPAGPRAARHPRRAPSRCRPPSTRRSRRPTRPARLHERLHAALTEASERSRALRDEVVDRARRAQRVRRPAVRGCRAARRTRPGGALGRRPRRQRLDQARTEAEQARDRDLAGLSELEERLHVAESRTRVITNRPPMSAMRCTRGSRPPGRPRWRHGSRSVPARSGYAPWPAAPSS